MLETFFATSVCQLQGKCKGDAGQLRADIPVAARRGEKIYIQPRCLEWQHFGVVSKGARSDGWKHSEEWCLWKRENLITGVEYWNLGHIWPMREPGERQTAQKDWDPSALACITHHWERSHKTCWTSSTPAVCQACYFSTSSNHRLNGHWLMDLERLCLCNHTLPTMLSWHTQPQSQLPA